MSCSIADWICSCRAANRRDNSCYWIHQMLSQIFWNYESTKFSKNLSLIIYSYVLVTNYGHTMAKSLIICGPDSNLKSQINIFDLDLVFCENNGWLMENMDKGLTVPKLVLINWTKIPQMPKKILPKPKSLGFRWKEASLGGPWYCQCK